MSDNNHFFHKLIYVMLMASVIIVAACGTTGPLVTTPANSSSTGFIVTKAGMYDSADTATVLVDINSEAGTVTLYNRLRDREYTLNYNGTSKLYDKYGSSMSMAQMAEGDIVDITFLKDKRLLNSMQLSGDAWEYLTTDNYVIDDVSKEMIVNGSSYVYDDSLHVYTDAGEVDIMDINPVDKISVRGYDRKVYSISIDEGHGYLRLTNEDYFVGGWLEVGPKIIRTIDEEMLIAVPIGTYDVMVSKGNVDGVKTITINRNSETVLDVGDLKTEEDVTYGTVIIVVTPKEAEVYIDGEQIDTDKPQQIEYGIHQLMAKAAGYQTLTQYIKVGQESATLDITMDKSITPITPTPQITAVPTPVPVPTAAPSTNIVSASGTVDGYKVTISSPKEAEVYVDGSYKGISPMNFAKVSGNHEITLRKEGYVTRSYTISIDDSKRDETFSFADLEKVDNDEDDDEDDDED